MDYFLKTNLGDDLKHYTESQIQWVKQVFLNQDSRFTFGITPGEETLLHLLEKTGVIKKGSPS